VRNVFGMEGKKGGKGKVVIVSGPSGVGKTTICREVAKQLNNVHISVSCTTRPKSENEVDGKDYRFVSWKSTSRAPGRLRRYTRMR
jgi:guanylate kinase